MKARRNEDGFTLVELMVGMLAASVLMLVVAAMLVFGWMGWRSSTDSVAMQRDAWIAMEELSREIRNSSLGEIAVEAEGIWFAASTFPHGRTEAVEIAADEIAYSAGVTIESFEAEITPSNTVRVAFTLATRDQRDANHYEMEVKPRN